MIYNPKLFVVTGGPGSGKTTLLRELERRGLACVPEVARQIIQEQVSSGGDAVPWGDTARYTELMLERSMADFVKHKNATQLTFFDRGIPDVLCYARLIGLAEGGIRKVCEEWHYNRLVFIAPAWEKIYTIDNERKQTFPEAVETYNVMFEAYRECGYGLIELPFLTAAERAEFVLERTSAGD